MPVEDTETFHPPIAVGSIVFWFAHSTGIDLKLYKTKYGADLLEDKKSIIVSLIKNNLVEIKDGFLRPTRAGMAVADSLALI